MRGLNDISFEAEDKVRKSLVSVSIAIFVISNVELGNSTLDVFGLELIVSVEKISAALRLVLILLLLAQALYIVERVPKFWSSVLRKIDDTWWERLQPEIEHFQGTHVYVDEEELYKRYAPEHLEWDDKQLQIKEEKKSRRTRIASYYRPIATASRTTTRYIFPVALAITALIFPKAILLLH